jgi:hypothetical protein
MRGVQKFQEPWVLNSMPGSFVGNTHATVWFQQDGAISHTARVSMLKLGEMFPHHLISRFPDLNWPQTSPDFSASITFMGLF